MKIYEENLPEGYVLKETVDFKSKKTMLILNIVATIIMLAVIIPSTIFLLPKLEAVERIPFWFFLIFILGAIIYIFMHEGTHALAGMMLTHKKPKFGIGFSVAYCYFEGLYLYKWSALIVAIAPLLVFGVAFIVPAIVCTNGMVQLMFWWLFAMHIGGCTGDIYDAIIILFKRNSADMLMLDDGVTQRFYEKEDIKTEQQVKTEELKDDMEVETKKGAEITIESSSTN